MGELRVSAGSMTGAAASVGGSASSLQDEYRQICAAADEVIGASWTGRAADGIRADWARWREGFEDVMSGLRREADLLNAAAIRYGSTDDDSASDLAASMGL